MDLLAFGINFAVALATIGLGLFGWLKADDTLEFLALQPADGSGLGKSEIRAASGAVWVGLGVGALVFATPTAFLMMALVYVGAATGRATAIIFDNARWSKPYWFLAYEVGCAVLLLAVNLPALP